MPNHEQLSQPLFQTPYANISYEYDNISFEVDLNFISNNIFKGLVNYGK